MEIELVFKDIERQIDIGFLIELKRVMHPLMLACLQRILRASKKVAIL